MSELQDIRDGLVYTLVTFGPYTAGEVSTCDFGIAETVSGCAVVLFPGAGTEFEPLTFGASGVDQATWSIEGAILVKETGDTPAFLARCWQAHDDFRDKLRKDRSLNDTAQFAHVAALSFNPELGREIGGAFFGEIRFRVRAWQYS